MKDQLKYILSVIGNHVPILRWIFGGIYSATYCRYRKNQRNRLFRENSIEVLDKFDKCMTENGISYCLIFGSLLGAVREKGFIKHDLDLDTAVWSNDYTTNIKTQLEKTGFKLTHSFEIDNGKLGREETYEMHGVNIDIFYFYEAIDKYPYCCSFEPMPGYPDLHISMMKEGRVMASRVIIPLTHEPYVRMQFETLSLPCPKNAIEILKYRYGNDYMVPKPKWNPYKDDVENVKKWSEVEAKFYEY